MMSVGIYDSAIHFIYIYLQARDLDRYLSFVKKCEVVQKVLKDFHESLCKNKKAVLNLCMDDMDEQ